MENIKKMGTNNFITAVYSAIWKNGPLYFSKHKYMGKYLRSSDKVVALKYLHDLQDIENDFLNKVGSIIYNLFQFVYVYLLLYLILT